jgi:CRP-like cAMP-binding protein
MKPSTAWIEEIAVNEAQQFEALRKRFLAIQQDMNRRYGEGRFLHRKAIAALTGELTILEQIPPEAKYGLFEEPKTYQTLIRLSNGGMKVQPDFIPDIRGFAMKIQHQSAPGVLGEDTESSDLLFINQPNFFLEKTIDLFLEALVALAKGPLVLLVFLFSKKGVFGTVGFVFQLLQYFFRPFAGFQGETFYTAAPISCGPYAIKLRLKPVDQTVKHHYFRNWGQVFKTNIEEQNIAYNLEVQFFIDEPRTPIENATQIWEETTSPYHTVGSLCIPKSMLSGIEYSELKSRVEQLNFDPWNILAAHKPLGNVMRARKFFYLLSQQHRSSNAPDHSHKPENLASRILRSRIWSVLLWLFVTLSAIIIPLHLVNIQDSFWDLTIEWGVSIFFLFDFVLRVRHHNHSKLQESRKADGLFWIDLIASVPWRLIFGSAILDLPRLLKFVRLIPLMKVKEEATQVWQNAVQLMVFSYWILLSVHWLACGWILLHIEKEEYLRALYWAVTTLTTVGYGDVTPSTTGQTIYTMIVMFLGVGIYGYIIGNVTNLLTKVDLLEARHKNKMEGLNGFLRYRNVSEGIQKRINEYYRHLWDNRMGFDEGQLMSELPPSLQQELSLALKQNLIAKVPFLQNASPELVHQISQNLHPVVYPPNDQIFHRGDLGEEMYFIGQGEVELVDPRTNSVITKLTEGDFFGEISLLKGSPRTLSARTSAYCDLYCLEKKNFDRVLSEHPDFAQFVLENSGNRSLSDENPIVVRYENLDREVKVTDLSKTLLEISVDNMIPHHQDCGGFGFCTTCRVHVFDGLENLSPKTQVEEKFCRERGWEKHVRLACQAKAFGNVVVRRAVQNTAQLRQLQFEGDAAEEGTTYTVLSLSCLLELSKSEAYSPSQIVTQHNYILNVVGEFILMNGGLIKLGAQGECIGLFGLNDPEPSKDIEAALRCVRGIEDYLQRNKQSGANVALRLDYGDAVIGSVGHNSEKRMALLPFGSAPQAFLVQKEGEGFQFQLSKRLSIRLASLTAMQHKSEPPTPLDNLQQTLGVLLFDEQQFSQRLLKRDANNTVQLDRSESVVVASSRLLKRLIHGLSSPSEWNNLTASLERQYQLYKIPIQDAKLLREYTLSILKDEYDHDFDDRIFSTFLDVHDELLVGNNAGKHTDLERFS